MRERGPHRRLSRRAALALIGVGVLPGCSWLGFAAEESADGTDDAPAAEGDGGGARAAVPATRIEQLEIGRTASGIALVAHGVAPGLGHARPRLAVRRGGEPAPDGFLEFDFVLTPPDPARELPTGSPDARRVSAHALLDLSRLRGLRGVRVHAQRNARRVAFAQSPRSGD